MYTNLVGEMSRSISEGMSQLLLVDLNHFLNACNFVVLHLHLGKTVCRSVPEPGERYTQEDVFNGRCSEGRMNGHSKIIPFSQQGDEMHFSKGRQKGRRLCMLQGLLKSRSRTAEPVSECEEESIQPHRLLHGHEQQRCQPV